MAIAPTGDIFKGFEFDGESSKDYGVYITGEAVYNAPTRDVEMISIPGRNGAFALDGGRFENIEITYPAGIFADDETNFAEAISDFRNYLCSRNGYVRLSDEYHPNEYRMAIYKSGLEVSPAQLKAGEFNIVFDCKPQRWLISGEETVTVSDGDELTNPTQFESGPLLEVEGYGTIGFNGYAVEIENATLGSVEISSGSKFAKEDRTISLNTGLLNSGDTITIGEIVLSMQVEMPSIISASASDSNTEFMSIPSGPYAGGTYLFYRVSTRLPSFSFTKGSSVTKTDTLTVTGQYFGPYQSTENYTVTCAITVTADASSVSIQRTFTVVSGSGLAWHGSGASTIAACTGISSKSLLGNPTYIDCDLGEAYRIDNGEIIPLNRHIDLGSDLPKLAPGANIISLDNTVTDLKIVPRWWKV